MKLIIPALAVYLIFLGQLSAQAKLKVLHDFGSSTDVAYPYGPPVLDSKGNLYGDASGGVSSNGAVFELSPQTGSNWKENILHEFSGNSDGYGPWGGLLLDGKGSLYGTLHGEQTFGAGIFQSALE